ncbi:hypothetical protein D6851_02610 [Altericroceibacterium spongiae]|uniref:DUF6950 domain-containing protein n=1 Tax=Altericroceibacterium spongiae TaxID=2320269 RepID=A0A420ERS5_9SPHN|nr:hypothetical protein [Altericroceibacterium spongiae]RKF23382.1 hypothetical protein D6851_02610 [Altericroceibacterium spongiae]
MDLATRAIATERVLERYRDKPFSWFGANCIRLARMQAQEMGHDVPPVPNFRTALGAKRALKKMGAGSVAGLLDLYFPRLPAPAFGIVGDLAVLRGDEDSGGLEAVCIVDGYGNLFGWHTIVPDGLSTIKQAQSAILACWRL